MTGHMTTSRFTASDIAVRLFREAEEIAAEHDPRLRSRCCVRLGYPGANPGVVATTLRAVAERMGRDLGA